MTHQQMVKQTLEHQCQKYGKSCCRNYMMHRNDPCVVCKISHLAEHETCRQCWNKEILITDPETGNKKLTGVYQWQANLERLS